jgi:ATP-dependent 26S proteasome regulatory subunit
MSSHESKIAPQPEEEKRTSPESPEDEFKVVIHNPDNMYLLAVKQAYEGSSQSIVSNIHFDDAFLSATVARIGFQDDDERMNHQKDNFKLESVLLLSDRMQAHGDHGYFSGAKVKDLKANLESKKIDTTECSHWPKGSDKRFFHNLLYVKDGDIAVRVDFGFDNERMAQHYLAAVAKDEVDTSKKIEAEKKSKQAAKGLTNDRVTLSLAINNISDAFSTAYPNIEGIDGFKQKCETFAKLSEEVIRSLYQLAGEQVPQKQIVLGETVEDASSQTSEWLINADKKESFPSFTQIGGQQEAVEALSEFVEVINNADIFARRGVMKDRGVLLYGEPGNGKSLLLQAVAKEADADFLLVSSADINTKWFGESGKNVKKVFEDAEKITREGREVIIGFEEMDAVVPNRRGAYDETKKVVATFLEYLDGPRANPKISIIGTTNRPDDIDPAIRRPGRIDQEIEIKKPDHTERVSILQIHIDNARARSTNPEELFKENLDLEKVAQLTDGLSGAQLASLISSALKSKAMAEAKGEDWVPVSEDDLVISKGKIVRKNKGSIGYHDANDPQILYNRV